MLSGNSIRLADHYLYGSGVEKNAVRALELKYAAAKNGDFEAQRQLFGIGGSFLRDLLDNIVARRDESYSVMQSAMSLFTDIFPEAVLWKNRFETNGIKFAPYHGDLNKIIGLRENFGCSNLDDYYYAALLGYDPKDNHHNWERAAIHAAENGHIDAQYLLAKHAKSSNEAKRWLAIAAEEGHPKAQYELGINYEKNNDLESAIECYERAAKQNDNEALLRLGEMLLSGIGIIKDEKSGSKMILQAAEQGLAEAQHLLWKLQTRGIGFEIDNNQARRWLEKAAEQGNEEATLDLAILLVDTGGSSEDIKKAVAIYQKYGEREKPNLNNERIIWANARARLGLMYLNGGDGFTRNLAKAVKYLEDVASVNPNGREVMADYTLAQLYMEGKGVPKNIKRAIELFKKAADNDELGSCITLASYYESSENIPDIDDVQAFKYMEKAAKLGHAESKQKYDAIIEQRAKLHAEREREKKILQAELEGCRGDCVDAAEQGDEIALFLLAKNYRDGFGVDGDLNKAFELCQKSANQKYPPAINLLGEFYYLGYGCEKDIEKSIQFFNEASDLNSTEAKVNLAKIYFSGLSVEKDIDKAASLLKEASELGDPDASYGYYLYQRNINNDNNIDLLKQAAHLGNGDALYSLAMHYAYGDSANFGAIITTLVESVRKGCFKPFAPFELLSQKVMGKKISLWEYIQPEWGHIQISQNFKLLGKNTMLKVMTDLIKNYKYTPEEVKAQLLNEKNTPFYASGSNKIKKILIGTWKNDEVTIDITWQKITITKDNVVSTAFVKIDTESKSPLIIILNANNDENMVATIAIFDTTNIIYTDRHSTNEKYNLVKILSDIQKPIMF